MTKVRTSIHRSGQSEIVIHFDEQSGLDPTCLIGFFQDAAAQGKRFLSGETIQVGWMVVLLKAAESGDLEIWEPQFDSIPVKWIHGVNNTLRHLILQRSVVELFKVEPMFPSLRDAGLASKSFLTVPTPPDFRMTRTPPSGNDSGWRFDTALSQNLDAERRSLFELSFFQMAIVPFLALPVGASVVKTDNNLVLSLNGIAVDSKQNQLLQRLVASPIWT